MKHILEQLVRQGLDALKDNAYLPADTEVPVHIERTRDKAHGDFACNVAMTLAKAARRAPRDIAQALIDSLPQAAGINKVEIAGPGFINFFLNAAVQYQHIDSILDQTDQYGRSQLGAGKSVQVEFVSANPTGPLHVGHGRGAAYGAAVADLLDAVGFKVHREYYVNDAGRQMDILGTSVWLRYLDLCGEQLTFPSNGYKGDYIWDIAATIHREHGDAFRHPAGVVFSNIPDDESAGGDKEIHIDALIARARELLGEQHYGLIFDSGLDTILDDIRRDLQDFGITYQDWFRERTLTRSGKVERTIERLKASGHTYEKGGALWFRSTDYGDEKDRVIVRDNGLTTYFASDIAYHADKLERGFERVIDIWGADHHGYVPRVKAAMQALGDDASKLDVLLVQFAILYRNGEKAQMSTRSGEFVTLRELREEVGNDAARFFYVMRKSEQHMDFDLDLAKSQSSDNPVYYIQYAHARVCSVMRQMEEKQLQWDRVEGATNYEQLTEQHEQNLISTLGRYPEILETSALNHEPHQLCHYLRDLANHFHTYYNAHTFIVDDAALRNARCNLIQATRQVIHNGLSLLGVSAPETM
ncbi:MAG TPA: arginine--tRNA ligase [Gammaproteobacteria bacterium]|nr:arginine--tRNA ligase [Gammaproteobacteria bacterium]